MYGPCVLHYLTTSKYMSLQTLTPYQQMIPYICLNGFHIIIHISSFSENVALLIYPLNSTKRHNLIVVSVNISMAKAMTRF